MGGLSGGYGWDEVWDERSGGANEVGDERIVGGDSPPNEVQNNEVGGANEVGDGPPIAPQGDYGGLLGSTVPHFVRPPTLFVPHFVALPIGSDFGGRWGDYEGAIVPPFHSPPLRSPPTPFVHSPTGLRPPHLFAPH